MIPGAEGSEAISNDLKEMSTWRPNEIGGGDQDLKTYNHGRMTAFLGSFTATPGNPGRA